MHQDLETLGQYLKRERESHRVPVEEMALFVRVDRSFIEALERDDFDVFAGRSECARLLKQYTAYLKLNQTEALRRFDAEWKRTGGVKRYPKLTQFADGDSSPVKSAMLRGKRLLVRSLPARRVWLTVIAGALIVLSGLFVSLPNTDLPDTKREITSPDLRTPSETAIDVLPAKNRVPPPAANAEERSVSANRVPLPEAPHPGTGVAEGKILPQPKGVRVIGNSDSKRYHLPGMKYYDLVKEHHRVVFQSEKEAIRAGYRRARE
jgi:cytoskeletal protein RodZ